MIEELKKRAKELGIKSAHLYKDEDKLKEKIFEAEAELSNIRKTLNPVVAEKPKAEIVKEPTGKPLNRFEVISGKFKYRGVLYKKGEFVESEEDLSPFTILKKV